MEGLFYYDLLIDKIHFLLNDFYINILFIKKTNTVALQKGKNTCIIIMLYVFLSQSVSSV